MIEHGRRIVALAGAISLASSAWAADHVDGPAAIADPAADIADIFAWTTPDAGDVNLVLTIPAAAFSDAVQYAFRIESSSAFGEAGVSTDLICTFGATQLVQCWVGDDDYVTGDASAEVGLTSDSGLVRVFAGPRDDPFFFNSSGFNTARQTIIGAVPSLTFDGAGCPVLDDATSNALITQLSTGSDNFSPGTVLALVVQVDRSLVTAGGDILAVWGSTHRT